MSDESKSLDILIRTKAELQGFMDSIKAMERQRGALLATGKDTSALDAQISKANAVLSEHAKKFGEAGEGMKPFAKEGAEVRKVIRELHEQFPIAANALKLLTNPVGGALAIAVGMFTYAKQALDKWNESMDETTERLRKSDFLEAINARKAALEAGDEAAAKFADGLKHLKDPEQVFQAGVARDIELLHERNRAAGEVADATHGLEEEKLKHENDLNQEALKRRLEMGQLTAQQYNALKLNLDADYFTALTALEVKHEQEKLARDKKAHDDELQADIRALEHSVQDQPRLLKDAANARNKATTSADVVAGDEAKLAEAEGKREDRQKAVEGLEAYIKEHYTNLGTGIDPFTQLKTEASQPGGFKSEALLNKYQDAINEQKLGLAIIQQIRPRLSGEKVDASLALSGASRAEDAATANANRINDQTDGVKQKGKLFGSQDASAAAAGKAKTDTAYTKAQEEFDKLDVGGGFKGSDVENIGALERIKAMGGPLNEGQRKQIEAFEKFANSVHANMHDLADQMFIANGQQTTVAQKVAALKKENEILTDWIKSQIKGLKNSG